MSKGGFWKGLFKGVGIALACVGASAIVYGTVPQFKELIDTKVFKQEQVTDDTPSQDGNNTSANEALAELQAKLAEANALLAEKETALENKQNELESAEASVTALETAVAAKENEIADLTAAKEEIEAEILDLENQLQAKTTELNEKQTALNAAIAERDAIQAELDASEETNTELQAELEAKNAEIANLEEDVATLEDDKSRLNSALQGSNATNVQLMSDLEKANADKAELQSQVDELEIQVTSLESEVETLEADKAELEEALANQYPDMAIFNSIFSTTSYGFSLNEDEYLVASKNSLYLVNTKNVTASLLNNTTEFTAFEKLSNNNIVCFSSANSVGYFIESSKTVNVFNLEAKANKVLLLSNGNIVLYTTSQAKSFSILNTQTFECSTVSHTDYSGAYGLSIYELVEHNGNLIFSFNTSKAPVLLYNSETESLSQLFAYENSSHSKFFIALNGDVLCGGSKDLYVIDGISYEVTKLSASSSSAYFNVFYETSNGKVLIKCSQANGLYLYDTNTQEFIVLSDSTSPYTKNFTEEGYIVSISGNNTTIYFNIYTNEISDTLSDVEMTDDELDDYLSIKPGIQEPGEEESGEKV